MPGPSWSVGCCCVCCWAGCIFELPGLCWALAVIAPHARINADVVSTRTCFSIANLLRGHTPSIQLRVPTARTPHGQRCSRTYSSASLWNDCGPWESIPTGAPGRSRKPRIRATPTCHLLGCGRITDIPWLLLLRRPGISRETFIGTLPLRCQRCGNTARSDHRREAPRQPSGILEALAEFSPLRTSGVVHGR